MNTWRAVGITLAFSLVFAACAGWTLEESADHPSGATSQGVKASAPLPSEDVPGRDMPDLPRYPGSVRVEYEHGEHDALVLTRARYRSAESLDTVRGFYRGVFRSEDWRVANAEFSDGEWNFLAVKGEREAEIEMRSHDAGVETDVRLSEPLPPQYPEKNASPEARTSSPGASRETALSRAPEPPAPTAPPSALPASPPPAIAGGGYGYEGD